MAKIEFYLGNTPGIIVRVEDVAVPREGEFVNILRQNYVVSRVTWAVDIVGNKPGPPTLRANVEMYIPKK